MRGVCVSVTRGLWLFVFVVGCAPRPPAEVDPGPRFPTHSAPAVPSGALGQPGDTVTQWGERGQWLAVCRPRGGHSVPRLIIDATTEREFDHLEDSDRSGRYVLLTHESHRWLYDVHERESHDLGAIANTTVGDVHEGVLAYGIRGGDRPPRLVLRTLKTGRQREIPSPTPWLHGVEIDRSGRGLWLTSVEPQTEQERETVAAQEGRLIEEQWCDMPTCRGLDNLPYRHKGLFWFGEGSEGSEGTFVGLDEDPWRPRALAGAVVHDDEQGVELIHPDRRERIAGAGCTLVPEYYDATTLLLRCTHDDGSRRYSLWKGGRLEPLDFRGEGDGDGVKMISGRGSRWLELGGLRTIQAVQHQRWGYAYGDHVMLVGDDVEIRDARTDTRVLTLPGVGLQQQLISGPYVALRGRGDAHSGGRVIDIRDGHVVRTYDNEALKLAPTGQVAQRGDDGRLRWTP